MSPLAPPENGNHQGQNQRGLVRSQSRDSKLTYTVAALYEMRHAESRASDLNGRLVPESISRRSAPPVNRNHNTFGRNFTRAPMDRFQFERTQFSRNRSPPPRHNRNNMNGGQASHRDANGERQRQPYRDNGHRGHEASSRIQIRLSIKTDVKLREAENAWKPSFLEKGDASPGENDAAELYKQVRSILNKLTAQNFGIMSEQFQHLKIDTKEKLVEVIDLVFNKAVNEPNFSEEYAKLSQHLSHCSKQIDSSSSERAYFKRTLINKCQFEFVRHVVNKNTTDAALAPLLDKMKSCEATGDADGVGRIKAQIAEEESILRRRLVCTVRFIGELYKLDMLTTNIMKSCITSLIREATSDPTSNSNQSNEKLECLCKLLTTIGRKLECKPSADKSAKANAQFLDLTNYMNQLKQIADGRVRQFKPSNRIKFMILDMIELRNNRWAPKITDYATQKKHTAGF